MSMFDLFSRNSVHLLSSGPVVAMELMGDDAVSVWKKFLEYVESTDALREARAQFVTDGTESFGHGSVSLAAAAKVRKLDVVSRM